METTQIRLTSAEAGALWNIYMIESLLIPFKHPLIRTCQHSEIKKIIQIALEMSLEYVDAIAAIFRAEQFPVPYGFTLQDANLEAPALYSDTFALQYIHEMAKLGLNTVPHALTMSVRDDVLVFLNKAYHDYYSLYRHSLEQLLSNSLYPRPSSMPVPEKPEYIQHDRYFSGWFGIRRPLNAIEIANLHYTVHENAISKVLLQGFSQVTQDKELRDHLQRGVRMAEENINDLEQLLQKEQVSMTSTYDSELQPSKTSPYSDKLILAMITEMGSGSAAIYGIRLSTVHRKDLGLLFTKLMKDALVYAGDGAELLVKRGWLEQPPTLRATQDVHS